MSWKLFQLIQIKKKKKFFAKDLKIIKLKSKPERNTVV